MQVTPDGKISIPAAVLEQLGFLPDTELEFEIREGGLYVHKKPQEKQPRVLDLHPGAMQMSEDFNAPLPDSFWLGEE